MARLVLSAIPHCLQKVNRVHYGLLERPHGRIKNTRGRPPPASRRVLTAIPFLGKDVPSSASEFADPETLICLTILAFRHESLRLADVYAVASTLKRRLLYEQGRFPERPSWITFNSWLDAADRPNRSGFGAVRSVVGEGASPMQPFLDTRSLVFLQLPLDLFQPEDPEQARAEREP